MSPNQAEMIRDYRFTLPLRGEERGAHGGLDQNGGLPGTDGVELRLRPSRSGAFTGGPMGTGLMREIATEGADALAAISSGPDTWTVLRRRSDRVFVLFRQGREETVTWARTWASLLALLRRDVPAPAMAELAWKLLARVCKAG